MERQSTGFQAHPPSLLPPTNHYSLASQESASSSRPSPPAQPLTARYVISNTQWEDLKPLIKQLYIEENRTFKCTAAILSDNYGFNPTKRQFSARVLRWGFRKNASLTEKLALVHRSTAPAGPEGGVKAKRWQRSTVTRWEREFQSSTQQSQAGSATYTISSSSHDHDFDADFDAEEDIVVPARRDSDPSLILSSRPSSKSVASPIVDGNRKFAELDAYRTSLAFGLWTPVDVPGSPNLSRLFEALTVHSHFDSADIDEFSLPDSLPDVIPQELTYYVSSSDLMLSPSTTRNRRDYSNPATHPLQYVQTEAALCHEGYDRLRYPSLDVFFPSGDLLSPSPCNEIYPFPISPSGHSKKTAMPLAPIASSPATFESQAREYLTALSKLQNMVPEDHPMVIETMEDLARTYFHMKVYKKSADQWRRVMKMQERINGHDSERTISAAIEFLRLSSMNVNCADELDEAKRIEDQLEATILRKFSADHELMLDLLSTKCSRINHTTPQRRAEAEMIWRQILQICLNKFGTRDARTIRAMSKLGKSMSYTRRLQSHKAAVQLGVEAVEISDAMAHSAELDSDPSDPIRFRGLTRTLVFSEIGSNEIVHDMMFLLGKIGDYEESVNFGERTLKRARQNHGDGHFITIRYMAELGTRYLAHGDLERGVPLLQTCVIQDWRPGDNSDLVSRMIELARSLREMRRYGEACEYFERCYKALYVTGRLLNRDSMGIWKELGECYVKDGRCSMALELWHHTVWRLQEIDGEDNEVLIEEVGRWISDLTSKYDF